MKGQLKAWECGGVCGDQRHAWLEHGGWTEEQEG